MHAMVLNKIGTVLEGPLASQDAIDHVKGLTEMVTGVKSVDTSLLKNAST